MLLENELVNNSESHEPWLNSMEAEVVPDSAATTKILRSRVRKLRRMQSQNFVQRAIHNVSDILGLHRESA